MLTFDGLMGICVTIRGKGGGLCITIRGEDSGTKVDKENVSIVDIYHLTIISL